MDRRECLAAAAALALLSDRWTQASSDSGSGSTAARGSAGSGSACRSVSNFAAGGGLGPGAASSIGSSVAGSGVGRDDTTSRATERSPVATRLDAAAAAFWRAARRSGKPSGVGASGSGSGVEAGSGENRR